MKRNILLTITFMAIVIFLTVQVYMVISIWKQKEENLLMRYKSLSREALSALLSKKKANGFEKAMDITDKFTGLIISEELPMISTTLDSSSIRKEVLSQTYSILRKNEMLSSFIGSYFKKAGYDPDYKTDYFIYSYKLIDNSGDFVISNTMPDSPPPKGMIVVNSFREEHNNFIIEFAYLLDVTGRKRMVFREAYISFILIVISVIAVIAVFWITWSNLVEEKRLSGLKSDFINNMTHELKTPLSTITVAGRTLEKEQIITDRERILETARMIGKQSIHLNQLINTILEVSLLERKEFEPDASLVEIDELTHQIVNAFSTSCDGCATIVEEYGAGALKINVDILYYTTMINNLLTNAVKYCDGKVIIKVITSSDPKNFYIRISDTGIGISREHLDHVFEKFYRITHGNIHNTKGLGLGLYYVRRIAEAHSGDVSVTSKPGKGTTFIIRLPI